MTDKITLVIAAVVAAFLGIFFTRYMVSGHQDHLVEVLIAQLAPAYIGQQMSSPAHMNC